MDLTAAINLAIAHAREADPEQELTDREILAEIRAFGHEEIDSWIEDELMEHGDQEAAYRAVIDASDDEITASRTTSARAASSRTDTDDHADCL